MKFFKKIWKYFLKLVVFVLAIFFFVFVFEMASRIEFPFFNENTEVVDDEEESYDTAEEEVYKDCSIAGVSLSGLLLTYIPDNYENEYSENISSSESINWYIKEANKEESIKAIVIEVDSYGGSPVAGEEIKKAIKSSSKPVYAFIRDAGLSASYLAITSADKIWASKYSEVGSIGITMSYLENTEKNKKDGYKYEQLSAGKFKDSGSPDMPLTKEEKDLFMRDVNIMYEYFIKDVSENRKIPLEEVREIADGSSMLGEKAKELKLIDEIGGEEEVSKYLKAEFGDEVEICW